MLCPGARQAMPAKWCAPGALTRRLLRRAPRIKRAQTVRPGLILLAVGLTVSHGRGGCQEPSCSLKGSGDVLADVGRELCVSD